jgi:hypothetical protein
MMKLLIEAGADVNVMDDVRYLILNTCFFLIQ